MNPDQPQLPPFASPYTTPTATINPEYGVQPGATQTSGTAIITPQPSAQLPDASGQVFTTTDTLSQHQISITDPQQTSRKRENTDPDNYELTTSKQSRPEGPASILQLPQAAVQPSHPPVFTRQQSTLFGEVEAMDTEVALSPETTTEVEPAPAALPVLTEPASPETKRAIFTRLFGLDEHCDKLQALLNKSQGRMKEVLALYPFISLSAGPVAHVIPVKNSDEMMDIRQCLLEIYSATAAGQPISRALADKFDSYWQHPGAVNKSAHEYQSDLKKDVHQYFDLPTLDKLWAKDISHFEGISSRTRQVNTDGLLVVIDELEREIEEARNDESKTAAFISLGAKTVRIKSTTRQDLLTTLETLKTLASTLSERDFTSAREQVEGLTFKAEFSTQDKSAAKKARASSAKSGAKGQSAPTKTSKKTI